MEMNRIDFLKEQARCMTTEDIILRMKVIKSQREMLEEEFLVFTNELWGRVPSIGEVRQKKLGEYNNGQRNCLKKGNHK